MLYLLYNISIDKNLAILINFSLSMRKNRDTGDTVVENQTETQLILFHDDPMEQLRFELDNVKKQLDNLRRGLFARHASLAKKYMEAIYEIEMLKSAMCQNQQNPYCNQQSQGKRDSSTETRGILAAPISEKVLQFDFMRAAVGPA